MNAASVVGAPPLCSRCADIANSLGLTAAEQFAALPTGCVHIREAEVSARPSQVNVIDAARGYLADMRGIQPRAHDLCVAVAVLADTLLELLAVVDGMAAGGIDDARHADAVAAARSVLGLGETGK